MNDGIELHDFRVSINGKLVVGPITANVSSTETVAILGPSGVGKSVLLRALAGLQREISGKAILGGQEVKFGKSNSFLLFQDYDALPWRTVEENLQTIAPRDIEALTLLESLGLLPARRLYPTQLSGGMRKRLAIGRGLLARQRVILIDEAFSSLDLRTREGVFTLVRDQLLPHRTVLIVTHDPYDAASLASRFWILEGPPATIGVDMTRADLGTTAAVVEEKLRAIAVDN